MTCEYGICSLLSTMTAKSFYTVTFSSKCEFIWYGDAIVSLPICKHLHSLKGNCQFSDKATKLIISSCKDALSISVLTARYNFASPAKSLQQFLTTSGISLMNTTNSIGPSTET